MTLDEIALKHGTDKASSHHNYTPLYERYLGEMHSQPYGSLLELGWGGHEDPRAGGASAKMWREWLRNWDITVIDNEPKDRDTVPAGIMLYEGDQSDPELINYIAVEAQVGNFDAVIDDASHISSLTIASFKLLWPHVKPGGWYVVEDTHMAYHDFYYGGEEANADPSQGGFDQPGLTDTAMGFLKRLADEANFRGGDDWNLFPAEFALFGDVEAVHFHFNICFIEKRR